MFDDCHEAPVPAGACESVFRNKGSEGRHVCDKVFCAEWQDTGDIKCLLAT